MICVNCKKEVNDNFCANCGEKARIAKITFASVFKDSFSTITNMDKGFLFNLKTLLLNPKNTVENYLGGKRKNILNPISFLVVSISIYLIADALIDVERESSGLQSNIHSFGYKVGVFLWGYIKYFWILSVVWLSLSTRLIFQKYNLAEHLTIGAFVIGQSTLLGVIGFLIFGYQLVFNPIVYLSVLWMSYSIFKNEKVDGGTMILALISTMLFMIQLLFVVIMIGIIHSKYGL